MRSPYLSAQGCNLRFCLRFSLIKLGLEIGEGRQDENSGHGSGSKAKLNKDLESLILNYFALTSGHAFGKDSYKLYSNYITKKRSFSTARTSCNPIRDKCRGKALSTDRIIAVPPVSLKNCSDVQIPPRKPLSGHRS